MTLELPGWAGPLISECQSSGEDVDAALKLAADAATLLRASNIERKAHSGLFNVQYYNGFFNELDDVHFLFKDVEP